MLKMIFILGFFAGNIAGSLAEFSPNVMPFKSVNTDSQMHVQIAYINMKGLEGYILDVPPIKTIITEDITSCQKECVISTTKCLSINLVELSGGGYDCSILSDDIYRKPWKKISKEGAKHLVIISKCVSRACQSPDVCIPEYENNTYSCQTLGTEMNPAESCKELYASNNTLATGLYWIRFPQDVVVQALCDMTLHDGKAGWLMIARADHPSDSEVKNPHYLNLQTLKNILDAAVSGLSPSSLHALYPFTKIRIKCKKESVGEILHIINSDTVNGKHLRNWAFGVDKSRLIIDNSAACVDAIVRLPDDDNQLSTSCTTIGSGSYDAKLYMYLLNSINGNLLFYPGLFKQLTCGDRLLHDYHGFWFYYVW